MSSSTESSIHLHDRRQKPWKYVGYRAFSTFLDSDHNFLVFRKFGKLNVRLLLSLQDKVVVAERELEQIDLRYSKEEAGDVHNGSFRREMIVEREVALERIHNHLSKYSKTFLVERNL